MLHLDIKMNLGSGFVVAGGEADGKDWDRDFPLFGWLLIDKSLSEVRALCY